MKKFSYLNIFLILFSINISSQNKSDLLEKLQNKFDSVSDFSANFEQSVNGNVNLSGKIYFKKENKLRLEIKNAIIVSDGDTNWNYNKLQNKVIISEYDDSDPSVFSLKKIIYDYPSECNLTYSINENLKILILKPKENSTLNFSEAKVYLNNNDLIEKVEINDSNNGLIKIKFSDYKVDQNLADSKFTLTQPEGSKIIDLR